MYFVHFILTTNYWTPHKYALLLSLLTFASMTTPLYIGYRFDTLVNHHQMLVLILLIGITIGQGLFVLAMLLNQNIYFYYSVIIIGLSSSSLVVIQRSIITKYFTSHQSFALSCTISIANVAKLIGRATTTPLAVSIAYYCVNSVCKS